MSLHSLKYAQKRRKKIFLFTSSLFFFVILLSTLSIFFFRSSYIQIDDIDVEGASLTSKEEIISFTTDSLRGKYFGLIPFSNIIFFPKEQIIKSLSEKFTELQKISIHRAGLKKISILVEERAPGAIACLGFHDEDGSEDCYFSDDRGYIFKQIATSTIYLYKDKYNKYYIPTDTGDVRTGQNFVEEKRFRELEKFLKGVIKGGLVPLGILIGESGEYEMYIKNMVGTSEVIIYFDDKSSFENTLSNLLTFWDNSVRNKKNSNGNLLDYIDLRFGNSVYYSTQ